MKLLLIATALLVSSAWAGPGARIIGGRDARAGEFPFAAAILSQTSNGQFFCGGALLTNQWVLTAGSCVDGALLFSIRFGLNNLDATGSTVVRVTTDMYFLAPDYNAETLQSDIALIQLRMPIALNEYIQPIALPTRDVLSFAVVHAIGWGQISDDEAGLTNELQTVDVLALSNEECRLYFGNQINDNMVCVAGSYNEGTCLGDTGGPLIQNVNGNHARVVGVASFLSGNGCESADPSGFTRTWPYLDWIVNHTGIVY